MFCFKLVYVFLLIFVRLHIRKMPFEKTLGGWLFIQLCPINILIAQELLLRGKIKKVLSRAQVCSLEQRTRNAHDQNEQTLQHVC